jgi:large subunit ribosomal protein L4
MTTTLQVRTQSGGTAGSVTLDDAIFGIEPHHAVLHQVVNGQLAARRAGTHSTKSRAEVRGGGAKPWRQKGTGRSRQGSIRSPQWVGGGVAHGPKPRSYRQKINKKMIGLALRSALSDRARSERVVVVDEWRFETPRTREALHALGALDLTGRVMLVLDRRSDHNAALSFRNLPGVQLVERGELNAYDILCSDWLVFTVATLPVGSGAEPEPEVAEVAPEPEPEVAEVAPESQPDVAEVAPEPEPDVAEVAPEPEPEVAEVAPEPEPEVAEVAPEPEPEVAEVAPEREPEVAEAASDEPGVDEDEPDEDGVAG